MAGRIDRNAVLDHLRDVIERVDPAVERAIVFGSVARGNHDETSDVDVVLVSPDFEDVRGAERAKAFRDVWDYDEFGAVDFLAYTPAEYRTYADRPNSLPHTADTNGIHIV